jgi:hypothetical protein
MCCSRKDHEEALNDIMAGPGWGSALGGRSSGGDRHLWPKHWQRQEELPSLSLWRISPPSRLACLDPTQTISLSFISARGLFLHLISIAGPPPFSPSILGVALAIASI